MINAVFIVEMAPKFNLRDLILSNQKDILL